MLGEEHFKVLLADSLFHSCKVSKLCLAHYLDTFIVEILIEARKLETGTVYLRFDNKELGSVHRQVDCFKAEFVYDFFKGHAEFLFGHIMTIPFLMEVYLLAYNRCLS